MAGPGVLLRPARLYREDDATSDHVTTIIWRRAAVAARVVRRSAAARSDRDEVRVEKPSGKIDKPMGKSETERQKRYFDAPRNQYPLARIVRPPLHTELELRYVLGRLGP